ncbi:MAG TPA: GIY-YIG nuclease family protein [Chitinophagaceae bacterium]|nr:GIY-YIG nuclease family protein [Chitinophagaceae bacterium]
MHYYVYILYSEHLDLYYIGSAADPQERLVKHLSNHNGFTAKAKDWKICFIEKHPNKTEALKRETQLKKWKNRARIESLIAQQH